jgi:hypothetical protein
MGPSVCLLCKRAGRGEQRTSCEAARARHAQWALAGHAGPVVRW